MKLILLTIAFYFSFMGILQAQTNQGKINVSVSGLRSQDGIVRATIFNAANGFPGDAEKAIKTLKAEIKSGRVSLF